MIFFGDIEAAAGGHRLIGIGTRNRGGEQADCLFFKAGYPAILAAGSAQVQFRHESGEGRAKNQHWRTGAHGLGRHP